MYSVGQVCKHTDYLTLYEQKGVDNPERFLGVGVNGGVNEGVNENIVPNQSDDMFQQITNQNTENPINQIIKLMPRTKKNFDISDVVSKLRNKKSRKDK